MIDTINTSNDSCAGPDGIPFAVYRAYTLLDRRLAETLRDIAELLGRGVTPPRDYNLARFFLIPKKPGGLIADTRGISVTNADNRLIAQAHATLLTPTVQAILHEGAKGFLAERVGTEHVHDLLNTFYSSLSRKQQMHVLLLDLKRAFDTLEHVFIHECLRAIGLAEHFRLLVSGLLHQVEVVPALAPKHRIGIHRGVKQGCPLSPLLFVICFDCLLQALDRLEGLRLFAYADDLSIAGRSVTAQLSALDCIRSFCRFSGLQVHLDKTVLVSARPASPGTRRRLAAAGWSRIKLVDRAVYLGVLFGPTVTTMDVCREANDKFYKRLNRYRPVLASSSLHTRILIINVFLLPLFYYLAQFIVLPYRQLVVPARRACHRAVVPFNGGGFGYAQLLLPRAQFGPHTALRDLWSVNMTLLAAPFDIRASHRSPTPELGEFARVAKYRGLNNSLAPADHSAYGAFVFLEDHAPRGAGKTLAVSAIPLRETGARRRAWIYGFLVQSGYETEHSGARKATSLGVKLSKVLRRPSSVPLERKVRMHAAAAARYVTPAKWNLQLRLTYNALPFDARRAQAGMMVTVRGGAESSAFPCFLCGRHTDRLRHVYGGCKVVRRAFRKVCARTRVNMDFNRSNLLLAFSPPDTPLPTVLIVIFNWSVWHLRGHFFATLASTPDLDQAVNKVAEWTLDHLPIMGPKVASGEKRVRVVAEHPPARSISIYTDGSALGNPGPAGAGVVIQGLANGEWRLSLPMGHSDNNTAEMAALEEGFKKVLALLRGGDLDEVRIVLCFTDSAGCLGYVCRGWRTQVAKKLARATRALWSRLKNRIRARLYWIRGHVGIEGNEEADGEAKLGAQSSKAGRFEGGGWRWVPAPAGGKGAEHGIT